MFDSPDGWALFLVQGQCLTSELYVSMSLWMPAGDNELGKHFGALADEPDDELLDRIRIASRVLAESYYQGYLLKARYEAMFDLEDDE